jgi:hypothetical protein
MKRVSGRSCPCKTGLADDLFMAFHHRCFHVSRVAALAASAPCRAAEASAPDAQGDQEKHSRDERPQDGRGDLIPVARCGYLPCKTATTSSIGQCPCTEQQQSRATLLPQAAVHDADDVGSSQDPSLAQVAHDANGLRT